LTPPYAAHEFHSAVAETQNNNYDKKHAPGKTHLTFKEKRLDVKDWLYEGENYKGSHFPLCVFTNNVGRRSEERFIARSLRSAERNKKKNNTAATQKTPGPQSQWKSHHWQENNTQSRWGDTASASTSNAVVAHGPEAQWAKQWQWLKPQ
jgi:hypothetical protein